jgi:hypothetical protein
LLQEDTLHLAADGDEGMPEGEELCENRWVRCVPECWVIEFCGSTRLNMYEFVNVTRDWIGWSMDQVVSWQPLTLESQVQAKFSPWRICGGQNGTKLDFSPRTACFPFCYLFPNASHSFLSLSLMLYKLCNW